ncbi:similar to Saccharomyces cerevisiae YOR118W RTC5 Protein of unknown function [Maudiozyma barnettii]|uniref:Restriction of telomere capping protein 5 n=1 Tax=Maudiozyma barnettii TaxID=61262 RepID=A0A8H2VB60_9SACH|nr:Rtc5p [Kazachstania barnettii]CAB4252031.1 similar to Saccharomyces cerevisiae YOR118W RTC5 Protein of unknown function [Kazachstania barnettii]CAD1778479.1 similar to Saccharomyces cerevisiae YOR118W RTC5 Protein of unknown function [Kazachstania barnettii]
MGQTGSTTESNTSNDERNINTIQNKYHNCSEIEDYFEKRAIRHLTTSEFLSYGLSLNDKKDLREKYPPTLLIERLNVPQENQLLIEIVLTIFKIFSNFPLINDSNKETSFGGVLKSIVLLSPRCRKYIGSRKFHTTTLIYIALSKVKQTYVEDNELPLNESYKIQEVVDDYNDTNLGDITVSADVMLQFITWLLALQYISPSNNCKLDYNITSEEWKTFEHSAKCVIRSMNSTAFTSSPSKESMRNITYEEYSSVFKVIIPNILLGLENLVEHLLYSEKDLVETVRPLSNIEESRLLTKALFSQIMAAVPKEIMITKLQKLYIGRESGFSMRSLQSKVFKWVAPTILLINGMRITDDIEYGTSKNPRYKKFLENYSKLRNEDQYLEDCFQKKRKVTFAVYINDPWKVTNKSFFGGEHTTVIQLSPRQDTYCANTLDVVFFNTIGGGIGIGDSQPIIKSKLERYQPGNVSLTIDNALEFGAFRNVGYGGKINPSSLQIENDTLSRTYELRFIIQDIEVWGCGGEKELEEQIRQLQWEEKEAKRRQHVNLKSLGEDRALLEMAGLIGQHQSGGSM